MKQYESACRVVDEIPRANPRLNMTKAQVANLSRETWIPKPKELFGHETMESLHGFVTVLRDHATCLDKPKRRSGDAFHYLAEGRATVADAPAFWSAAGSEAPRRLGFCARGEHETGVPRASQIQSAVAAALCRRTPQFGGVGNVTSKRQARRASVLECGRILPPSPPRVQNVRHIRSEKPLTKW